MLREREKIVSRETFYVLSHAYLEIYTYALILCVERERENCIILYVYIHVLISMFFGSKVFFIRFQSLYLIIVYPYEILCVIIFNWI